MQKIEAKKLDMSQIFNEDATVVPVTELLIAEEGAELVVGEKVDVVGRSKGKGFAGVIKRWSFSGGPHTHGQKDKQRTGGSIGGGTDPGKVWKGKKMGGRMGTDRVTVKNLEIIKADGRNVWVKGAVPGHRNALVTLLVKKEGSAQSVEKENHEG